MIPAACTTILAKRHPGADPLRAYRLSRDLDVGWLAECAAVADASAMRHYENADYWMSVGSFANARFERRAGDDDAAHAADLRAAADLVGIQ